MSPVLTFIGPVWESLINLLLKFRRWYVYRKAPSQFLSPTQYYARFLDETSSIHHVGKCLGREDELEQVLNTVDSGNFTSISIYATPGSGISRYLLELARLLEGRSRGPRWYLRRWQSGNLWTVYFARKDSVDLLSHISELRKGNIVVIFDSPQTEVKEVAQLVEHADQVKTEGKLLVVTGVRKAYSYHIQQAFLGAAPGTTFHQELAKLSRNVITKVIERLLPAAHPQTDSRIQNLTQDSIFLTVLVCQAIKKNKQLFDHVTDPTFIFGVCIQPMREVVASSGVPEWQCCRVFAVVASLCPFEITSDSAVQKVSELTHVNSETIRHLLDAATQAGLFEKYASQLLRPIPDLFGTLLIEQACIAEDGSTNDFGQHLISNLLKTHPKEVIKNAANVGWSRGNPLKLVKEYIRELRNDIDSRETSEQGNYLRLVQQFAPVDPLEVMDYVELLVRHYQDHVTEDEYRRQQWEYVFSDICPVLIFCGENSQSQQKALEIARILYVEEAIHTDYSNRTIEDCLEKTVGFSPLKSIKLNRTALNQVKSWLGSDEKSVKAAITSLRGLLKSTFEWDDTDGLTFTLSEQLIRPSGAIKVIRNEALALLCHPKILTTMQTTKLAFDVLGSAGDARLRLTPAPDSDLHKMLQDEEQFVLGQLSAIYKNDMPVVSRVLLEEHLWTRWTWGSESVARVAEKALARCSDSTEHRIQRLLLCSEIPISIGEVLRDYQEGDQDRLDMGLSDHGNYGENFEQTVNELLKEFNYGDSPERWRSFLQETSTGVDQLSWKAAQFFTCLAQQFPSTAWDIFDCEEKGSWKRYPIQLLIGLRQSDKETWFNRLQGVDPTVGEMSIVNWLCAIDRKDTDERERQYLNELSKTDHESVSDAVVYYLAHSGIEDWYYKAELLLNLLEKFRTEKSINNLFSFLSRERPEELKDKIGDVDERALSLLLHTDLPHNVPWIEPHWIGPYFKIIASIDPSRFLTFLMDSTNSLGESEKYAIEIRGLKNADEAMRIIIESMDSPKLIEYFIQLADSSKTIPSKVGINLLSRNFLIDDTNLQLVFSKMLQNKAFVKMARILGGYGVTDGLLNTLKKLVVSCVENQDDLDEVKNRTRSVFYIGFSTRSPGYAKPRDNLVVQKMTAFLDDGTIPAEARSYFEELKNIAEGNIQHDLDNDELLIGRKFTSKERSESSG